MTAHEGAQNAETVRCDTCLEVMAANDRLGAALDYVKRNYGSIYLEACDYVNTHPHLFDGGRDADDE